MNLTKWLWILLSFTSNVKIKGEKGSLKHESACQQDLFACSGFNISIISDVKVFVGSRARLNQPVLCSMSSPQHTYLQIRLKHFYDICAVTTWAKDSNGTEKNFRIQYPGSKMLWQDYKEMEIVKDFQGVRNNSGITLHRVHFTTKDIRFLPVNWKKGACLQFAIHGTIASCKDSPKRMDIWCKTSLSYVNASNLGCSGELRARFDRNEKSAKKIWRCYYESSLTPDLRHYDNKLNSPCYFSRHLQLNQVSKSCSRDSLSIDNSVTVHFVIKINDNQSSPDGSKNVKTEKCPLSSQDGSERSLNHQILAKAFRNLSKVNETTTEPLSSSVILDIVNVLEKVVTEKLLKNTTQNNRDQFAKTFLKVSSVLLNETNIPTWTSSLSNSTTLSRLLKVVEDFGVLFSKYLECDNKTEKGKTFSFSNIKFIARSCVNRGAFPLKLFSSQGCGLEDNSSDYCNTWSDVTDSVTLPESMLGEQKQYQVSFISYKNAHRLFPVEPTKGDTHLRSAKVDSRIFALTLKPEGFISNENPVILTLKPFSHNSKNQLDFQCGFWNFSASATTNGAWSTDGCTVLSINASQVTCQCDHLTNFALLLQVNPDSPGQGMHREVLMWMTYLGCSLSLVAEILCLLAFILLTNMKEIKVKIHFNLIACLAGAHLVFLTAIERAAKCKILCRIVAVSLHFLFLASFMWMLVEGIHLLSRIKAFFRPNHEMSIAYGLAYGLTLAIVGITFAMKFDEYGTVQHCWLSFASGTKWTFIGPVCAVILVNFVALGLVLKTLTSTRMFRSKNEWQKMRLTVRASLTILPLLGLTWLFGLLAVNQQTIVFQYLFVGFNSLQGVFLFLFHCAVNTEVQAGVRSIKRRRRVTQQVKRVTSKARDNTRHEQPKISLNVAFSFPFKASDEHVVVLQSMRLTGVIQRGHDKHENNGNNKDYKQKRASAKNAWGKMNVLA